MKIVVGMGSIDAYCDLVRAGADEVFCGYVPYEMVSAYSPVNRREVRAVNVQLGSESEMRILADMVRAQGIPVTLTFNALCYTPLLLEQTANLIERCVDMGFGRVIVADPALLVLLNRKGIGADIHISGEVGEINRFAVDEYKAAGVKRIIFHRKVSIKDMASIVRSCGSLEYEAFALNEMCHFHGGFCNTLHCDELMHMCREPYRLNDRILSGRETDPEIVGFGGCGMCALWKLRDAGITHLKIVSRGNHIENTLRDVGALKGAIRILERSESEDEFITEMKNRIFPQGCGHSCYYRDLE